MAVQNPNDQDAHLKVRFLKSDGTEQVEGYAIGADTRWTFNASLPLGVGIDAAVVVKSNRPVIVERMMYFSYGPGWKGGHAVLGASHLSTTWFLPEGSTREGFEEYICIANPGDSQAYVTLSFMLEIGDTVTHELSLAPEKRVTVGVNSIIGSGRDVSARVSAPTRSLSLNAPCISTTATAGPVGMISWGTCPDSTAKIPSLSTRSPASTSRNPRTIDPFIHMTVFLL
ncbi:MAG: hypothetical protein AB1384_00245 [Actinomycetota bacterium]